ncbi:MAG: type II CAAX endopeptidase family protein [Minisyncoccia bacterium]
MGYLKKVIMHPVGVVIISIVLIVLSNYPSFFLSKYGLLTKGSLGFLYFVNLSALILLFIVPILIIKFILKRPLEEFGLSSPKNWNEAVKLTTLATIVLLSILFFIAKDSGFQKFYAVKEGFGVFFLLATLGSGIYYVGEEFLFRGFMFFALSERVHFHSFWITSLVFALLHATKPSGEVIFAFISSLIFCYLSQKTRSFLPAFAVHFIIALGFNLMVMFHY